MDRLVHRVRIDHPQLYRAWFEDLGGAEIAGGELLIPVTDATRAAYLREHCTTAFSEAASIISARLLPVRFVNADRTPLPPAAETVLSRLRLNPDYTFDQFVVGPSNRLAHAACRAICAQPGTLYNPLFIHGRSGLGKSHLLQATCDALLRAAPGTDVIYMSCDAFINDLVRALESGTLQRFRDETRHAGVLVLDDVQFLANRESPQEELFHTFNALYNDRRQIILSADAPPSDIPKLEDRLVSRFNWGVVGQVDPPDRETRHAILLKKARLRGVELPDDVVDIIAERCDANIRLLEGALSRLIFESQAAGRPITVDVAREMVATMGGPIRRAVQINDILEAVAAQFSVRLSELVGRRRTKSVVLPRQVGMYLARKLTSMSLEEIGAHFGGRDHATVLYAEKSVADVVKKTPALAESVAALTRRLER